MAIGPTSLDLKISRVSSGSRNVQLVSEHYRLASVHSRSPAQHTEGHNLLAGKALLILQLYFGLIGFINQSRLNFVLPL